MPCRIRSRRSTRPATETAHVCSPGATPFSRINTTEANTVSPIDPIVCGTRSTRALNQPNSAATATSKLKSPSTDMAQV